MNFGTKPVIRNSFFRLLIPDSFIDLAVEEDKENAGKEASGDETEPVDVEVDVGRMLSHLCQLKSDQSLFKLMVIIAVLKLGMPVTISKIGNLPVNPNKNENNPLVTSY